MTDADIEAVPPHLVAEIAFGDLITHPRPAPPFIEPKSPLGLPWPFDPPADANS